MVFRDSSKVLTHHKSMGAIDPPYVPRLDARGLIFAPLLTLINRIYVGDHYF